MSKNKPSGDSGHNSSEQKSDNQSLQAELHERPIPQFTQAVVYGIGIVGGLAATYGGFFGWDSSWGHILMIVGGLMVFVSALLYVLAAKWRRSVPSFIPHVVNRPRFKPKTLLERYEQSFGNELAVQISEDRSFGPQNFTIPMQRAICISFIAQAKFLSVYIPEHPKTDVAIAGIINTAKSLTDTSNIKFEFVSLGEKTMDVKNVRFTSRIFVYHESSLNGDQHTELERLAKRKKINLQLRGPEYEIAQNLYEQAG